MVVMLFVVVASFFLINAKEMMDGSRLVTSLWMEGGISMGSGSIGGNRYCILMGSAFQPSFCFFGL